MKNYNKSKSNNKKEIPQIDPWMIDYLAGQKLWIMRNKDTGKPLNVSYSPDGLK